MRAKSCRGAETGHSGSPPLRGAVLPGEALPGDVNRGSGNRSPPADVVSSENAFLCSQMSNRSWPHGVASHGTPTIQANSSASRHRTDHDVGEGCCIAVLSTIVSLHGSLCPVEGLVLTCRYFRHRPKVARPVPGRNNRIGFPDLCLSAS